MNLEEFHNHFSRMTDRLLVTQITLDDEPLVAVSVGGSFVALAPEAVDSLIEQLQRERTDMALGHIDAPGTTRPQVLPNGISLN